MNKLFYVLPLIALIFSACSQKEYTTAVTVKDKDGLINDEGKLLVKPVYEKVYFLDNMTSNRYEHPNYVNFHWLHINDKKFAVVKNIDGKYGIIDKEGNLKLKVVFDSIGNFFNGYAKVEFNGKFGLINENFDVVLKPVYDSVRDVIDNSIIVKNYEKNKKVQYGCINSKNMSLSLPLEYDMIFLSSEDRMRVLKDSKWGFIDTKCKLITEVKYDLAGDFSNSVAKVKKENLWTYINKDGKELHKAIFEQADNF
ncbi:WG repeat-containing protein [Arcobacter sp. YIC-464]|uniref:WG repeat-containing protein n=1 Tax=Arcobacter sp. YIC-464 TaxID=3376631 RepID=UPI003C26F54E